MPERSATIETSEQPAAGPVTDADASGPGPHRAGRRAVLAAPALAVVASACNATQVKAWLWLRSHLPAAPVAPAGVPPAPTPPPAPATPTSPEGAGLVASMVVDKLTFGPTPGLVAAVQSAGPMAWIDAQLDPSHLPDAEAMVASDAYATLRNTNLQNYQVQDSDGGQDLIFDQMDHAALLRATYSQRQLYEVMCDFWANHFNIWRRHTWMGFLRTRDIETVIRPNALGRFSDMLVASTHSPAMLDYLDNLPNDASSPGGVNQNYARELLELHTLGIIDGVKFYTEDDVQAVAQIISGWALNWSDGPGQYDFAYLPWQHSYTAVSCFGGAFTAPARSYGEGYDDGVRLVDFLAHHPSTARYIAWKLCRHFVADSPPMSLVDSTAAVFTANGTAIAPTLRHIFVSPEFAASAGTKVRRPLEHLVASLRALGASLPTDPQSDGAAALRDALGNMGQAIYERVSPDGYPDTAGFWVSSEGLLQRWAVAATIARNGLTGPGATGPVTVSAAPLLPNPLPATVGDLISALATAIGNYLMPAQDVADLCTAAGLNSAAAATTLTGNTSKLALVAGLLLCHPSFQRR